MSKTPRCIKCEHYYVTWDRAFPYGCKAMGFKSFKIPATVVRESSGQECLVFIKKQPGTVRK